MQVKNTVFGSKSERQLFYQLAERWQGKLNIWHNLAFRAVFDFDNNEPFVQGLSWPQRNVLHTSSIDYVFCDPATDEPIACVEFDGLSQGYSSDTSLFQRKPDQRQPDNLSVKLRFADRCRLPFFVISSSEAAMLAADIKFAIIDGVIGDLMAQREVLASLRSAVTPNQDGPGTEKPESMSMEDWLQMRVLGQLASVEYMSQLENNPVSQMLHKIGYPFYADISFQPIADGLVQCECRLRYWDRAKQFGDVISTGQLRMPIFQSGWYASGILPARILLLMAFDHAARQGITPKDIPPVVMECRVTDTKGQAGIVFAPNNAYRGDRAELPDWCNRGFFSGGTVRPDAAPADLRSMLANGQVVGCWYRKEGSDGYLVAVLPIWGREQ
jgi:hypothetical protein